MVPGCLRVRCCSGGSGGLGRRILGSDEESCLREGCCSLFESVLTWQPLGYRLDAQQQLGLSVFLVVRIAPNELRFSLDDDSCSK